MCPVVRKVLQAQKLLPLDGGVQEGGTGEPETIWNYSPQKMLHWQIVD